MAQLHLRDVPIAVQIDLVAEERGGIESLRSVQAVRRQTTGGSSSQAAYLSIM